MLEQPQIAVTHRANEHRIEKLRTNFWVLTQTFISAPSCAHEDPEIMGSAGAPELATTLWCRSQLRQDSAFFRIRIRIGVKKFFGSGVTFYFR